MPLNIYQRNVFKKYRRLNYTKHLRGGRIGQKQYDGSESDNEEMPLTCFLQKEEVNKVKNHRLLN